MEFISFENPNTGLCQKSQEQRNVYYHARKVCVLNEVLPAKGSSSVRYPREIVFRPYACIILWKNLDCKYWITLSEFKNSRTVQLWIYSVYHVHEHNNYVNCSWVIITTISNLPFPVLCAMYSASTFDDHFHFPFPLSVSSFYSCPVTHRHYLSIQCLRNSAMVCMLVQRWWGLSLFVSWEAIRIKGAERGTYAQV